MNDSAAPGSVEGLVEAGNRERAAGRVDAAAAAYERALRLDDRHAGAHVGLGWARTQQRYFVDAARHYLIAAEQRPRDAGLLWEAGRLHLRNYTFEDAVGPLLRARDVDPDNADIGIDIARAYVGLGAPELAIPYLEEALASRPDDPTTLTHLGSAAAEIGDFERAGRSFRRVIELGGDVPYALFRLALNGKYEADSQLGDEIDQALETVERGGRSEQLLHQAAFRIRADADDWPAAYEHLLASKRLVSGGFDRYRRADLLERSARLFDRGFLDQRRTWGDSDSTPVFVVGMPRSGSTLVETVLAGHPSVTSLGERNYVDVIAHELWYGNGQPDEFERRVRSLDRSGVAAMAAEYVRRAQMLTPAGRYPINKMLTNYQHVGLIMMMFPRARFVHCLRSPLDSCWSIFSNPIEHGHPYARSMHELAWAYGSSLRAMEHWRSVAPESIIDVVYEDFVDDLPKQTERLLSFLGLPWSDDCLTFEQRERSVQTMSSQQVRTGLYRSSIGRWRRHREFLAPLVEALIAEGVMERGAVDG